MDLGKLTEYLVKSLVKNPDALSVNTFESEEGINIEVLVASEDIGTVIGKGGSNANAIRTLVQAAAYNNHMPRIRININERED